MIIPRDLDWAGCLNVRDLGNLRLTNGGETRRGAVVRADHPARLTPHGWSALWEYGIRTIVSLETSSADADVDLRANRRLSVNDQYPGLTNVRVGIEDGDDAEFMERWAETGLWGTPLYFEDALARWPQRHAEAVAAVAHAGPGGVLIHCGRGCDRTGILSVLLLAATGVQPAEIAKDYARSASRLAPREPDYERQVTEAMHKAGTSVAEALEKLVRSLDVNAYLLDAGLTEDDLATLRNRLVGCSATAA